MIRLPLTAVQGWIVAFAVRGVINLFFPLGWALLRNHPPGTSLRPVQVITPVPFGGLAIATWPETFLASLIGVALLVVSALLARPAVAVDTWLARALLGPGALDRRVRELERIRSLAVDGARQDGQERLAAAGLVQDRAQLGGPAAQLRGDRGVAAGVLEQQQGDQRGRGQVPFQQLVLRSLGEVVEQEPEPGQPGTHPLPVAR